MKQFFVKRLNQSTVRIELAIIGVTGNFIETL